MTLYARSDLSSVVVSAQNGGCGTSHSRPVKDGAPAKVWQLACPACETVLRTDPLWAGAVSEIPETPDEQHVREDRDKRGAKEQAEATAVALERIGNMPEELAKAFVAAMAAQAQGAAEPTGVPCRDCAAPVTMGQKFCGECGARDPAHSARPATEPSIEYAAASYKVQDVPLPPPLPDPGEMSYSELRRLAVTMGLSGKGTKAELLERLSGAESAAA
jgi:hypothetical protein